MKLCKTEMYGIYSPKHQNEGKIRKYYIPIVLVSMVLTRAFCYFNQLGLNVFYRDQTCEIRASSRLILRSLQRNQKTLYINSGL